MSAPIIRNGTVNKHLAFGSIETALNRFDWTQSCRLTRLLLTSA